MTLPEIRAFYERQRHDADLVLGLVSECERQSADAKAQATLAQQRAAIIDDLKNELSSQESDGPRQPAPDRS